MEKEDKDHFYEICKSLEGINFDSNWVDLRIIVSNLKSFSKIHIDKYEYRLQEILNSISKDYPKNNDDLTEIKKRIIFIINEIGKEITS